MSVINPLARELSAKIVYYGPGLSGKTTSLSYIHSSLKPSHRGELVSLATEGDRTLFFDFLPVHLGKVRDLDVRLQLYTVPGQVFYGATRQLVLDGADGVVFVADSQRGAHERNVESLMDLRENLEKMGSSLDRLPFVIQYNKRDLPDIGSIEEMREQLNPGGVPDFATTASKGVGVVEALKTITRLVTEYLAEQAPKENDEGSGRLPLTAGLRSEGPVTEGLEAQVSDALMYMGRTFDNDSDPPTRDSDPGSPLPAAPDLNDLGSLGRTPRGPSSNPSAVRRASSRPKPNDALTIQAPAASPLTFSALWDDESEIHAIEQSIATGHFAEAVYRCAGEVSGILDNILGPHSAEGSAVRAQLLGLDGHEYLQLRNMAGRPASTLTQLDALFSLYMLVSARIKEARLGALSAMGHM